MNEKEKKFHWDSKIPDGPLEEKWNFFKRNSKLISPNNRKKFKIIVVGTGLSGCAAAATLAEQGYQVSSFCFHESARRAHSIAAQGGVNAAKNYKNDGDSVTRMFRDTLKGGDFRSREANVYRLSECSIPFIDLAVSQGVPFNREYGGYLENRSFGGVQVSRTFYSKGQTGQQLLLGAYQALMRQIHLGNVKLYTNSELLDYIIIDGQAKGIIVRNLLNGQLEKYSAHAIVVASGGFGKIYYLSTLALGCNATAVWRAHKKGALFANPSWTQIHPTSLPQSNGYQSKLTLMSESLRNDGRIWVPKSKEEHRSPGDIPEEDRDYYLERKYPSYGNLAPRDISSRAAKERIDLDFGVGPLKNAVYLDFKDAKKTLGEEVLRARYGNLFDMYKKITDVNPLSEPMLISPSAHFSMGGLWVDYELMTSVPGLYAIGEANFADHGANRLGANSLLQASVDGYFILPVTLPNYLHDKVNLGLVSTDHPSFLESEEKIKNEIHFFTKANGQKLVDDYHKELGKILYDACGLKRSESGLKSAIETIQNLRENFLSGNIKVPTDAFSKNAELEKAGRMKDYLELAELMCLDALLREESCGAHFRMEHQTADGEAKRDDKNFQFVSCFEWSGDVSKPILHKETLEFEYFFPKDRDYK
ncbi:succinate dehydrogenase or fumarate reductase, flavoprotein subunit [Leptospira wolbachii serovar Codice str. CDC]|uniref:succinate dehydrogenase n=1 Tax=Leptospira wolbachii serovar Codice str. CDC TaxID=1218599 RepID=R9A185_9LEPT|nr:fumarate reductase/succinate dehydrogenase flavoprotein subunit [Leptospira wolbachii]EOQ95968.1 succinate dehydrogenase or fumarate reductase, flavoprotein subunit [Leptospira wolbachii serovar Codice str. CDC]